MESYSNPVVVETAFKDFFMQVQKENKELKKLIYKQKNEINILEAKLITIKIALESFSE